jgi:hypothetical protein
MCAISELFRQLVPTLWKNNHSCSLPLVEVAMLVIYWDHGVLGPIVGIYQLVVLTSELLTSGK